MAWKNAVMGWKLAILALALALIAAACGGNGEGAGQGGASAAVNDADLSLAIQEPTDGSEITLPTTLSFTTNAELGDPESGLNHVHVWFDGNESTYEVVTSNTFEITDLPEGEHTITVSLRNANHSAAGADDEISVVVAGGATE
jgi:hypothetical protein